tara:strand:+ start:42 stop:503 length:462 start_codon:yes stop_codon:yes gene_type:complete
MVTKYISHRGNLNGREKNSENTHEYIGASIAKGFDCEIDIWKIGNDLILGHDKPENITSIDWISEYQDSLWIHCKNYEALFFFNSLSMDINYFWHQTDDFTLTSQGHIWTYPKKEYFEKSVIVNLEEKLPENLNVYGICSDYIEAIKNKLEDG